MEGETTEQNQGILSNCRQRTHQDSKAWHQEMDIIETVVEDFIWST